MNYVTIIQLNSSIMGRRTTYTTDHGEEINPGGHSPFIYRVLDDDEARRGALTVCIHPIHSKYKIGPVNTH